VEGDDHCEAYTAIVRGGLLSRERKMIAEVEAVDEAEDKYEPAPLCEELSLCRGQRPHHVQRIATELRDLASGRAGLRRAGPHREGEEP